MKKTLAIFLSMAVLLCTVPHMAFAATTTEVDGITYELNDSDKTATLTNGTNASGDLVIPSSVNYNGTDYSVTSIGDSAFNGCGNLRSVTIPDSVISISVCAFNGCSSLTSVTISNSVTSIGVYAFWGCNNLTSVTLGSNMGYISDNIKRNLLSLATLTSINIDPNNQNFKFGDGVLFNKDGTELVLYLRSKTEDSYNIPSGVQTIGNCAFDGCSNLTSITIPDGITSIGEFTFYSCEGLMSIEIPGSVQTIGKEAFYNCSALTSVTIGKGVTTIGNRAFSDCRGLTSVTVGNKVESIGAEAFRYCNNLKSITIPCNFDKSKFDGTCIIVGEGNTFTVQSASVSGTFGVRHDLQYEKKEPDCVNDGEAEHYKCNGCGTLYSDADGKNTITKDDLEQLKSLGHDWDAGEVTTAATPEKSGVKTYTCSRCGETKTEPVEYVSVPGGGNGGSTDTQPNVASGDNNSTNLHPGAGGGNSNSSNLNPGTGNSNSSSNNSYSNAEVATMAKRASIKTGDQMGIWVMFDMALLLMSAYGVLVDVKLRRKKYRK